MRADWTHKGLLILSLLIVIAASGCFQSAGGALEATSVAQSAPTFTPTASETPSETPTPFPSLTPTEDQSIIVLTRVVTATATPTAPGGTEVADVALQDIVAETSTAIFLTSNAQFQPLQAATTEVPPVVDPLLLSATAIIRSSTETAAAPLTQTAQALLGITPTSAFFPTATTAGVTAPVVVPSGADCVHEVRATDRNLFRIGLNYGVTYQTLATYNNLVNPNLIYIGQRLVIPGCGTTGNVPPATSTATTTGGGVPVTPIPGGGAGTYIVQDGDTLFGLSQQWGRRVMDIAAVNGITNVNLIYFGQTLVIP